MEISPELQAQLKRVGHHLRRAGAILEAAQAGAPSNPLAIRVVDGEVVIVKADSGETLWHPPQRGAWI